MYEQLHIILNIAIASFLCGFIGLEREVKDKPAGLRTQMIVGGASALLVSLGKVLITDFGELPLVDNMQFDPIRIIEAIIVGVSFIGAGTILQVGGKPRVQNLTTAASLLFSAGVGISTALELYVLSVSVTVLALLINLALRVIERKIKK